MAVRTPAIAVSARGVGSSADSFGAPLPPPPDFSRKISASLDLPRVLDEYESRQRPARRDGYLDMRHEDADKPERYTRRWFVLDDLTLSLRYYKPAAAGSPSTFSFDEASNLLESNLAPLSLGAAEKHHEQIERPDGSKYVLCGNIPLHDIKSLKANERFGPSCFMLRTVKRKYQLRASSRDDMNAWLFGFHRSIAAFVTSIMRHWKESAGPIPSPERSPVSPYAGAAIGRTLGAGSGKAEQTRRFVSIGGRVGAPSAGRGSLLSSSYGGADVSVSLPHGRWDADAGFPAEDTRSGGLHPTPFGRAVSDGLPPRPAMFHEYDDETDSEDERHVPDSGHDEMFDMDMHDEVTAPAPAPSLGRSITVPGDRHSQPARLPQPTETAKPGRWMSSRVRKRVEEEARAAAAEPVQPEQPAQPPARWMSSRMRKHMEEEARAAAAGDGGGGSGASGVDGSCEDSPPVEPETHRRFGHVEYGDIYDGSGTAKHGLWFAQGSRPRMEDAHIAVDAVKHHPGTSVYGVFDGHGGNGAAIFAAEHVCRLAVAHESFATDLCEALTMGHLETERLFLEKHDSNPDDVTYQSGSTALVIAIRDDTLTICNLGDCRAVLCRANAAVQISQDHKPESERARIEAAGGWLVEERELCFRNLHHADLDDPLIRRKAGEKVLVQTWRVNGELAVSRALGDAHYKGTRKTKYKWWHPDPEHEMLFSDDLVIATPEVTTVPLDSTDKFVILACDGVWDVLENNEAVDFVVDQFASGKDPTTCSRLLAEYALRLGSSDNISVLIVVLNQ